MVPLSQARPRLGKPRVPSRPVIPPMRVDPVDPEPVETQPVATELAAVEQLSLVAEACVQPRPRRQRTWKSRYTRTSVAIDLLAAFAAIGLGLLVRFGGDAPAGYLSGSFAFAFLWVGLVAVSRAYEQRFIGVGTEESTRVFRAGVALMAAVAFTSYATKEDFARGYVVVAIPSVVLLSLLGRCVQRSWLHRERRHGRCVQRTLVVGSTAGVRATVERLQKDSSHGMQVVAACVSDTRADPTSVAVPVAGGLPDIVTVAGATETDLVTVLPTALFSGQQLRRLAWDLEPCGADLVVCSGLTEVTGGRITVRPAAFSPMLQVERPRLSGPARAVKGLFDRSAALAGLVVISPVMVAIAAGIWAHDRRNPFFRQVRVGLDGREFGMWKFRTMVVNAEELRRHLVGRDPSDGPLFKMVDDPRITSIGRTLRRYSLDELPQLFNVMLSQMSLVGPRPPLPDEVRAYGQDMRRRLLVKPGMTGLWQVSGRADLSWGESELLDLRYVENWSLGHDFAILWRTVRTVATGSGAY